MNRPKTLIHPAIILFLFLWLGIGTGSSYAQFSYANKPLIGVIEDLQQKTGYRFLYRETMLADIRLSLQANEDNVFSRFKTALQFEGVQLDVDSTRRQVILFRSGDSAKTREVHISGQVIDASTGERLPFATIAWKGKSRLRGVTSNTAGAFSFSGAITQPGLLLRASYVGYASETIRVDLQNSKQVHDLTFRLKPEFIGGDEVVITGLSYYSSVDTSLQRSVDIGTFSPLGESSTIRALQMLPSVNLNAALNDGINVRGSPTDGFQVLLDGITIYNQSHLFGLLDSFNADALQTSGLFYDITPAQYQAPPGGTLSLYTKTGSLNEIGGSAGVSNSSYRLTIGGPVVKGKSSWLLSGRNSYMNQVDWLNNSNLIEWGLDVDRPREVLSDNLINFESRVVRPDDSDATFYDLHGKLYFEGNSGGRFILSGYYGKDDTRQSASRLFETFRAGPGNRTERRPVETVNEWGNVAGSAQFHYPFSSKIYSYSTAGVSIYDTDFRKDDFTYTRRLDQGPRSFFIFTEPLAIKSILNEVKVEQRFDITVADFLWTIGASYQYYLGEYFEDSFDRPGFFIRSEAHKIDGFAQVDIKSIPHLDLFAGTRLHYYSNGEYLKWSPRAKFKLFPEAPVSVGGGYSRNYQYLNQVSLSNVISSDVWVLANAQQPPASVDYFSAGLYLKPFARHHLQIEGYIKDYEHIRLHEINTFSLSNTFAEAPWFSDNDGYGKGVEFVLSNRFRYAGLSQSLTISEMQLRNPVLNDGKPFFTDWDRTYRYAATLEMNPLTNFAVYLSWMYATGSPNKLAVFGPANEERLDNYMRTDLSLEYDTRLEYGRLKAVISVYNLLDRNNPWYRELSLVVDPSRTTRPFQTVPVNVYDLGIQPSFNLSFSF